MANDTFATFQQISGLGATDFLVGYRNISETRIGYNDLTNSLASGLSSFSAGTYTTVNANSASWQGGNSAYTSLNANSSKYESAYTNLNSNSALYGFISAVLFS